VSVPRLSIVVPTLNRRESVLRLLRARCDAGTAGVLVTHEARHAAWADRVVFLRDGTMVDSTPPRQGPETLLEKTP
jgi:putative ABC transport system ATP-binding protein